MPGGTYTGPLGPNQVPAGFSSRSGRVQWVTGTSSPINNFAGPGTILCGVWVNTSGSGTFRIVDSTNNTGSSAFVLIIDYSAAQHFFVEMPDVELKFGFSWSFTGVSRYGIWYI